MYLARKGGMVYVSRGDNATIDFTQTAFTMDSLPHELSLAAIVPANTKAVMVRCLIQDGSTGQILRFRPVGYANWERKIELTTIVASKPTVLVFPIILSTTRTIEYLCSSGMDIIELNVEGWFL